MSTLGSTDTAVAGNTAVAGLVAGLRAQLVSEVTPIGVLSDFLLDVRVAAGGSRELIATVDQLHAKMIPPGARRSVVLTSDAQEIADRVEDAAATS
jgi:hypothetical protein